LGLKELLQVYLDHRLSVVRRRSEYRLARRRERLHLVEGLLIAILDIDEVIQVIRQSDDSDQARARLIDVFDLSELQAEYILELRLRRLTKFSRIELEAEADKLRAEIAYLEGVLADPARIRQLVSEELEQVAERFGTPRRTLLTEARASVATTSAARKAAPVLEIADAPCEVLLSTTGRAIRIDLPEDGSPLAPTRRRSRHDAIRSRVTTTSRSEIGAVTSTGRLIRLTAVDLPSVPANSIQLAAGAKITEYLAIGSKERVLGLVTLDGEPIALGTRQGTVKRVAPGSWPSKPEFEIISLKPGDEVVGVSQGGDGDELVFVTSDAQLLHFGASAVRPQGPSAGGMAGVNLSAKATVTYFGSVDPAADNVVVTLSTSVATIAGADPGRGKVSPLSEFPGKGRATGGVRAHSFLKGEDVLALAWVGAAPANAVGTDGSIRTLPETGAKRDASGTPLDGVVGSVGSSV
ncbi:MAG TPA: DNA gyrase subunit A, partial [Rhodoglobus sp.]|nr:DNA gyrase subunit A [Rhodoglobus sp.]